MPRKAPDNVTEHRITFGNLERAFLDQQQEQAKTTAILKGVASVGPSLGIIVIGGGVALAAYAFWNWAGLTDLPGKIGGAITGAGTKIGETILGTTVEEQVESALGPLGDELNRVKQKCSEDFAVQTEIANNPNSTANQKAMAELEMTNITRRCKKKVQSIYAKLKHLQANPEYVAMHGTWLGPDTVKY